MKIPAFFVAKTADIRHIQMHTTQCSWSADTYDIFRYIRHNALGRPIHTTYSDAYDTMLLVGRYIRHIQIHTTQCSWSADTYDIFRYIRHNALGRPIHTTYSDTYDTMLLVGFRFITPGEEWRVELYESRIRVRVHAVRLQPYPVEISATRQSVHCI